MNYMDKGPREYEVEIQKTECLRDWRDNSQPDCQRHQALTPHTIHLIPYFC